MNASHRQAIADFQPGPHRACDVRAVLPERGALGVLVLVVALVAACAWAVSAVWR